MGKNSPKKKDMEFSEIGEYEDIKKKQKVKEKVLKEIEDKLIHFDKRQYSCKLPKHIMDRIYKKGDKLKFTLIKEPSKGKIMMEIEYVHKWKFFRKGNENTKSIIQ